MSTLETNLIQPSTGTSLTIGASGDTVTIPSGCTLTNSGTISGFGGSYTAVYRSSDQTISDATWTKIQFNAEFVDSANAFDSSTNYRFTPQTAGHYFVLLNLVVGTTADNSIDSVTAAIYKNGSEITGASARHDMDTAGFNFNATVNAGTIVQLNGSSDYIEAYGNIDVTSGTPRFEANRVSMQIFRLAE